MLANRLYLGDAVHTGIAKHGAHYPRPEPPPPGQAQRAATPALLKGLIFGPDGKAMPLSHTRRRGRLYRFYRTATSLKLCHGECPIRVMPAGEIEAAVMNQLRGLLRAPEVVARVWRAAQLDSEAIDEREVVEAPQRLQPLWDQLFRVEQARIVQILVERGRGGAARRGCWSKR